VRLYVFDKKLRLLALDALERIEMAVRVDVAHVLGQRDPLAHEKPACLHGNFNRPLPKGPDKDKTPHKLWLAKYHGLLKRARKEAFVAHHQQHYGRLPIWAAIEVWDFGLLSRLFTGMRHADQQVIARMYDAAGGRAFAQWLRSLNFIRNVSAHHSRLWNINVLELSPVPQGWPAGLNNARPFFYFSLMQHLLGKICPNSSWGRRLGKLLRDEFPETENPAFSLAEFGAFANWEDWALWPKK